MATPGEEVLTAAASPTRRTWTAALPAFVAPLPAFPSQLPNAPNRFPRGSVLGAAALSSRGLPSQLRADIRQPGALDDRHYELALSLAGTSLKQQRKTPLAVDSCAGGGEDQTASVATARLAVAALTDEDVDEAVGGAAAATHADTQQREEASAEKDSVDPAAACRGSEGRAPPMNGRLPGKARRARAPPPLPPPRLRASRLTGLDDEYMAHLAALRRRMAALHRRSEPEGREAVSPRRRRAAAPKKLGDQLGLTAATYLLAERKPIRLQEHFNFYP